MNQTIPYRTIRMHSRGREKVALQIPEEWLEANGLKAKDRVSLFIEADGSLRIVPAKMRTGAPS